MTTLLRCSVFCLILCVLAAGTTRAAPFITLSTNRLDFGNQLVGTTSNPQSTTLTNISDSPVRVLNVVITGTNLLEFAVSPIGGGSFTLQPGDSRDLPVTFSPIGTGLRNATLTIVNDAPGGTLSVALTGTGFRLVPGLGLAVTPINLNFGDQPVSSTSAPQVLLVRSTGTLPVTVASIGIGGKNPQDFTVTVDPAPPFMIAGGQVQALAVQFTPRVSGSRTASVLISSDAPGSPIVVPLVGNGGGTAPVQPGALNITPFSLSFGIQTVGSASAAQSVTLTNTGNTSLTISRITLTGANAGDFALTVPGGIISLAPKASQIIGVTFTPKGAGSRTASLSITSSAAGSPTLVPVSGTGLLAPSGPTNPLDWPVFMQGPRQLGLAGTALDPSKLTAWQVPVSSLPVVSPVIAGGTAYVGTQDTGVIAIDIGTRTRRWNGLPLRAIRAAPAAGSDVVVVSAETVYGLNVSDGSVRWQRTDIVPADGVSPMRANDVIYVGSPAAGGVSGMLYALRATTGATIWPARMPAGLTVQSTAAVYPELGMLFVGLGPLGQGSTPAADVGSVLALRLADGTAAWTAPTVLPVGPPPTALSVGWVSASGGASTPLPALFVVAGTSVTALNALTGATLWTRTLQQESALVSPPVVSSASVQPATLYVAGTSGRVYVIDPTTGTDLPGGFLTPTAPIVGNLALAGNFLYVPTGGGLIAADAHTGAILWSNPLSAATGVAVANGVPFVGAGDGQLVSFSR
jgi:outer membrane protein assembly factor BamB